MVDSHKNITTTVAAATTLTNAASPARPQSGEPTALAHRSVADSNTALAPRNAAVKPVKTIAAIKPSAKRTAAKASGASGFSLNSAKGKTESPSKSHEQLTTLSPATQTLEILMTQSKYQIEKITQDATTFNRESFEACIKSSNLWMKGCEDIVRTAMSLAQSSAERQSKYVKETLSSKTLNEWAEIQNKNAQSTFGDFVSGTTKISEQYLKVLSQSTEPVSSQATKALKKFTETLAA